MTKKDISWYKIGKTIRVNNKMQKGYKYKLVCRVGDVKNGGTDEDGKKIRYNDFKPYYTPAQMLKMGVFEGKYLNDCYNEYPKQWFDGAKKRLRPNSGPDPRVNYFGVKSRLSLNEWWERGWIPQNKDDRDFRGWFEWYCRYYIGRRQPSVDLIQIKRWKSYKRHYSQVEKNAKGDLSKRRKQRQGLLQWSWKATI